MRDVLSLASRATTLFAWLVLRRLSREWLRASLLVGAVALSVSVFLAVIYASDASVRSFTKAAEAFTAPLEVRSRRGTIPRDELSAWYPQLAQRIEALPFAARQVTLSHTGEQLSLIAGDLLSVGQTGRLNVEAGTAQSHTAQSDTAQSDTAQSALAHSVLVHESFLRTRRIEPGSSLCLTMYTATRCFAVSVVNNSASTSLGASTVLIDLSELDAWEGRPVPVEGIAVRPPQKLAPEQRAWWQQQVAQFVQDLTSQQWVLRTSADQAARANTLLRAFRMNIIVMVLLTLLVSAFTVFNAAQLSVRSALPDIATLHTLGLPRSAAVALFLSEAVFLGGLGSAAGLTLGRPLSLLTANLFLSSARSLYAVSATAVELRLFDQLPLYLASFAAGVLVCVIGAALPALQARSVVPGVCSRTVRLEPPPAAQYTRAGILALIAIGVLATASALHLRSAAIAHGASFAIIGAVALSALPALRLSINGLKAILRRSEGIGPAFLVASGALMGSPRASALAVSTTAFGVSLLVGLGVMVASFRHTLSLWIEDSVAADVFISSTLPEETLPAETFPVAAEAAMDSVRLSSREASVCAAVCLTMPVIGTDLRQESGKRSYRILKGGLSLEALGRGEGALLSESGAALLQVDPGQTVSIVSPGSKPRTFTVQAVYKDFSSERGNLLIAFGPFSELFKERLPQNLSLYLKSNTSYAEFMARIRSFDWSSRIRVQNQRELKSSILDTFDATFQITGLLRVIVVLVCVLGFAITLGQLQWDKRREWRTLQIMGASDETLLRSVAYEATLLSVPSIAVGMAAGALLAVQLVEVINPLSFGWTLSYAIEGKTLLVPVLGIAAAYLAPLAWYAGRCAWFVRLTRVSDE